LKSKKKKSTPAPEEETDFGGEEDTEEEFDFGGGEETEEGTEEENTEESGGEFDFGGEEDTEEEGGEEFDSGETEDEDTEEELDFDGEEDTEEEDTEEFDEDDEDYDLEDDPIKDIQRMTGKLGQKIRDTKDLASDTMKWVAKSVISALDLENMDSNDKRDIIRSIKKGKNKSSDEESDFMGRGRNRQSYQEYDSMDYMGSNEKMTSWDELTEEEKEEIISGMNNGIGGDETEPIEVMRGDEKFDLILDDEDGVDYMSHGLPNQGPFGELEKVEGGYDLYISNNIDINDIPEHFSIEDVGDPIFYDEEEIDTLKTDIKELDMIAKGETEEEDYMYRHDEDYMDYLEMKNPGTKEKEKTREKEKEKTREKNPFKRPERINPDEEPAKARYDEYGDYGYGTEESIDYMRHYDEDYMECPVCNGRNSNCNSCGGRGVFNRNEANNEVDEPFMKGVDYSDNSQYSLRKRIMDSMLESMKNPGTKEKEKTREKEKEKTREKNPFKRPERINPDEEPAKAKYKKK
jgi:hypothetical protein